MRKMLKSKELEAHLKSIADKAQSQLGEGYEVTTYVGEKRANASVMANTVEARQENSKNNTILKAVIANGY